MSNLRLSIVMATMATMSTMMLGLGQGSVALPLLTMLAASLSVTFTDWLGWFQLNRMVANVAMLMAAFFSLYGFLDSGSQQQLWAIANLLIYVQLVLLFQEKNRRVFGQLAMFSLLQVVVAALLNSGLEFGLLLAVYMVIALLGFVLFFVYREVGRVGMVAQRRSWLEYPPVTLERLDAVAGEPPAVQVLERGTALNDSIVSRRITPPILAMVGATAVFTSVFFYITPRTGGMNWERGMAGRSVVGFSPEVTFDEMGRLLQSEQRVMRVSFSNAKTGEPYTVIGEPYLRGAVLTNYVNGRWLQEVRSGLLPQTLASPPSVRDLVQQDILLEPTGSNRLFSMFPVYALAKSPEELRIDPRTRHLFRADVNKSDATYEYRYTVVTTAFNFGAQLPVIPHPNRMRNAEDRRRMIASNNGMLDIYSEEEFPGLIALANQIVQEKAPGGDSFQRARALEMHFQEGGRYTYTLDMGEINRRRRPDVDPIEDFVTNHRMGHCEYFASALTLMLRSQDIPARMVIGYRPNELNYIGNYYVVRQRDAHAWVEAYLRPNEIPDDLLYPEERHAGGGWLRLEPTPQDDSTLVAETDLLDQASKSFDYARWLWNDYVLRLTEERQKQAMLDPLSFDRKVTVASLIDRGALREFGKRIIGTDPREIVRRVVSWRGALAVACFGVALYLAFRLVRAVWPLIKQIRRLRPPPTRRRRAPVQFYRRLESALTRIGLRREATQTQRQFAGVAAQRLAESPHHAALADIPHQIVDAFYRVRFGQSTLDPQQQAVIARQLKLLEETLAN
jgi:transglutaminase-like putative cysteine protease